MYLKSMQKNIQYSKNSTANAVNLISKPANKRFHPYFANCTWNRRKNNLQCSKNWMANDLNPILKLANKRFRLYLANRT